MLNSLDPLRISSQPGVILDVVIENPGVTADVESLEVHSLPESSSTSSINNTYPNLETTSKTSSVSPSITSTDYNQTRDTPRAPQYRPSPDVGTQLTSSNPTIREPQLITGSSNDSKNIYNHTQPVKALYSTQASDIMHETRNMIENYNRGRAYLKGSGVAQSYIRALDFFQKAANQGHGDADNQLENMSRRQECIQQDYSNIIERYREDAEDGSLDAQCNLGFMYQMGFSWYRKAAEQGHARAQCSLGSMYYHGYGVTQDYSKAMEWYQKSADQGDTGAQCNLGVMYCNGHGVTQDYSKAMEWYQKSADQGDTGAQCNLGFMYEKGHGVTQDYSKAAALYQKSADQGHAVAQSNLGFMYENGHGVAQDYSKAVELLQKSAEQGEANAQYTLGCLYKDGKGAPKDLSKAKEWWSKAASQDHAESKKLLDIRKLV
ncbi:hypothetical protein BGZ46_003477 [Entomortierella lignicola]|nr:hypothetical protein BGZ46_003477 [Entomortierella lignicola]